VNIARDWHKVAVMLTKRANLAMDAGQRAKALKLRCASLAASMHNGGEGWATIRKLLPDFDAALELVVKEQPNE